MIDLGLESRDALLWPPVVVVLAAIAARGFIHASTSGGGTWEANGCSVPCHYGTTPQ